MPANRPPTGIPMWASALGSVSTALVPRAVSDATHSLASFLSTGMARRYSLSSSNGPAITGIRPAAATEDAASPTTLMKSRRDVGPQPQPGSRHVSSAPGESIVVGLSGGGLGLRTA